MHKEPPLSKVFYRPIEAAIRWAGLLRYKASILASIASPRCLPQTLDCPRWNECRLYSERIYDGILNSELPFGKNGITLNDPELVSSPDLTIRHVDLKRWMRKLQAQHEALLKQSAVLLASKQCAISDRAETTYLNIIGGMLTLMLGQSPSGVPYSSFKTQEAIVTALLAHYGGTMGITERTLNGKFANARKNVRSAAA